MPVSVPAPTKNPGDVLTSALWNSYVRDNINKLLNTGHRVLTVAQFAALTGLEGTKGTVAPDEVYLEVDATNGIQWHFAYESGEPTYKWRFLGGPPLVSTVLTAETTSSVGYAALATAGPSVTLPRGGDYDIETHARQSAANDVGDMSFDIGGTGAVDADAVRIGAGTNSPMLSGVRLMRKTALAASTALVMKYKKGVGAAPGFDGRIMRVTPVRII